MSDAGPVLAADGRPLKQSLNRALRRSKLRALALIAPLLIFVLVTFIAPIADMLFRSVENQIVSDTLPRTLERLPNWDPETGEVPDEALFRDFYYDFALAQARKDHTKLGSRLNYETSGMASLFRQTGRKIEDVGEHFMDQFTDVNRDLDEAEVWVAAFAAPQWFEAQAAWARAKRASEGAAAAQAAANAATDAENLAAQAAEITEADIEAAIAAAAQAEAELGAIEVGTDAYVAASGRLNPVIAYPGELQGIVDGVVPAAERAEAAAARAERIRAEILAEGITAEEIDSAPTIFSQEEPALIVIPEVAEALPFTASLYAQFADVIHAEGDSLLEEDPEAFVFPALYEELSANPSAAGAFPEEAGAPFVEAAAAIAEFEGLSYREAIIDLNDGWGETATWATIQTFSPRVTSGYFLASADLQLTPEGVLPQPEDERVYIMLFIRTLIMSLTITGFCILLGYPVAYHLATIKARTANLLMILVLLPFWTSLLVRTSAWKALLQQQGVINDLLVWWHGTLLGKVLDPLFTALCYIVVIPYNALAWVLSLYHRLTTDLTFADVMLAWPTLGYERLALINNQTGTIIAMTHILLPFMILPLYSVMKTIPPSYVRAAKSLGATPRTAFWRVYFPQSVPGIGAGSILVFILAIGYYITPEIVGGTKGVFISNRIAYHISSSLNWGLAAALGSILLVVVLALYWTYDKIVGIDNVKLGG